MTLNSAWFRTFSGTQEQRKQLEQTIKGSSFVLNILTEIIEKEIASLETTKTEDYSNANWPLWTADKHGQTRALKKILELTKLPKGN